MKIYVNVTLDGVRFGKTKSCLYFCVCLLMNEDERKNTKNEISTS